MKKAGKKMKFGLVLCTFLFILINIFFVSAACSECGGLFGIGCSESECSSLGLGSVDGCVFVNDPIFPNHCYIPDECLNNLDDCEGKNISSQNGNFTFRIVDNCTELNEENSYYMVKNLSDSFICLDVITDNLIIDGSGLVDSSGECSYVPNEIFLNETVCIDHDYICNIWIFPPLGGAFLLDSLHVDLPSDCNCNLSPGLCDQTGLRDSCLGNVNLSSKDLYIRNRNNITIKNTDCLRNIILEDSSFSYSLDSLLLSGDFLSNLIIINSLVKFQKEHNSIEFQGRVNSLGSPESFRNAISINSTDFYVDTLSKPELNKPAVITLFNSSFTEGIALKFNNQIPPEGTFNILSYNPFKVWIKGFEICERIIDPCYDCYYYGEYRYHSCSCETFYGWESRPSYNDILPCPSGTTCIDNLCQQ